MNNDLISREALKKQFANECVHNCYYCKLSKWDKKEACTNCGLIDNAPTVEPRIEYGTDGQPYKLFMTNGKEYERPQGEWIPNKGNGYSNPGRHCSLCNTNAEFSEPVCPGCGSQMKIGGEES